VTLQLVNVSAESAGELIVQAGAFGEHAVESVQVLTDDAGSATEPVRVDGPWFRVLLDGSATLRLRLTVRRFAYTPSYAFPWSGQGPDPLPLIEPRFN
jgi:hypothetical protein